MTLSDDGNRAYIADPHGRRHADPRHVARSRRARPNPQAREVSRLTWTPASIPQNAIPFTERRPPVRARVRRVQRGDARLAAAPTTVGAARIIDIADETPAARRSPTCACRSTSPPTTRPRPATRARRARSQGYAAHYCNIPTRVDPKIVACSFIASGPARVRHHRPRAARRRSPTTSRRPRPRAENGVQASDFAMSQPAFVPERREVWFTDGDERASTRCASPTTCGREARLRLRRRAPGRGSAPHTSRCPAAPTSARCRRSSGASACARRAPAAP